MPKKKKKNALQKAAAAAAKIDAGSNDVLTQFLSFHIVDPQAIESGNFVKSSCQGCYVAQPDSDWLLGYEPFDAEEFSVGLKEKIPDISIDPKSRMLSVINQTSKCMRCFYITLGHTVQGYNGAKLEMGSSRDAKGNVHSCITFIILVPPLYIVDVCYVDLPTGAALDLHSDISDIHVPTAYPAEYNNPRVYDFPLDGEGPYLCSQGFGGEFTHFFPATCHAIDFECPVGTPVLAIGDGKIVDIQQENTVSGIHTRNLYLWNSIMVRMDDGVFVEYVHIQQGSATVAVGDRVVVGQKICNSGDVGFCPLPHLHIQLHMSDAKDAITIPFAFKLSSDHHHAAAAAAEDTTTTTTTTTPSYVPIAGRYYNRNGPIIK